METLSDWNNEDKISIHLESLLHILYKKAQMRDSKAIFQSASMKHLYSDGCRCSWEKRGKIQGLDAQVSVPNFYGNNGININSDLFP